MISIVMTVYNGEKYLEEQLKSLARQTLLPDELLIGDDGSIDGTETVIRRMAGKLPFPVYYVKNETRLGYAENFRQTAGRSRGDLLFFCDQDDVWKRNKLERMVSVMEAHPEISVLVSSFWLTDSFLGKMQLTMDQMLSGMKFAAQQFFGVLYSAAGTGKQTAVSFGNAEDPEMIPWEAYLRHPRYPGMTMAFRRELWEQVSLLPWPERAAHDWMVCEYAAERDGLYRIPDRLVFYRQHGDNTTGTAADRSGNAVVHGRVRLLESMAEEAEALCRRENLYPEESGTTVERGVRKVPGVADKRRKKIAARTAAMLRRRICLLEAPFSGAEALKLLMYDIVHLDCMTLQSLCGDLVSFLRKYS